MRRKSPQGIDIEPSIERCFVAVKKRACVNNIKVLFYIHNTPAFVALPRRLLEVM